ncbi:hypothetical protein [Anaeromyxobacter oryzae]|nr:hypothetical protein [Anaeromyxobacter oryzae]
MSKENPKISHAVVHRPNDFGVDLPAGKDADELDRSDYRVVEIEDPEPARDDPAQAPAR